MFQNCFYETIDFHIFLNIGEKLKITEYSLETDIFTKIKDQQKELEKIEPKDEAI